MKSHGRFGSAARAAVLTCAVSLLAVTSVQAQDLTGRWRLELRAGVGVRMNSGVAVSAYGVETTVDAAGFLGSIGCARWFSDDVAGTLSVGMLSAAVKTRADTGGVATNAAVVVPFFVGVRRYLPSSDPASGARFFGSVEVGPVTGHESSTRVGTGVTVEAVTRSAFGGRTGVGAEVGVGGRLTLGLVGGFTLMTDFSDPIGGEKNHSGPDVGLTLGILLGG
jgi:hypothetical protein